MLTFFFSAKKEVLSIDFPLPYFFGFFLIIIVSSDPKPKFSLTS